MPKLGHFFSNFRKRAGETSLLSPLSSYVPEWAKILAATKTPLSDTLKHYDNLTENGNMKPTISVSTGPFTSILLHFDITANTNIKPVTSLLFHSTIFKNTHFNAFSKISIGKQKMETLKTVAKKKRLKKRLDIFKLLGFALGSRIDIL